MPKQLPNIYIYNPTADMAILNGTISYMAPARLRTFEKDLSLLPALIANTNDVIISDIMPSSDLIKNFNLLQIPKLQYNKITQLTLDHQSFNRISPWSWSPVTHHKFNEIKQRCSDTFISSPNYKWKNDHKQFFSRKTSLQLIEKLQELSANSKMVSISQIPLQIKDFRQLQPLIKKFNNQIVIKTPWSASGRGVQMLGIDTKPQLNINWIKGAIKQQGYITIEPYLQKIVDISFQFDVNPNGDIEFANHSFFINDDKGHFVGSYIEAFPKDILHKIDFQLLTESIYEAKEYLTKAIRTLNLHHLYTGPVGVDALFYVDDSKQIKIHPCCEINLRYTMGYYNLKIRSKLHPEAKGTWHIKRFAANEWQSFKKKHTQEHPLETKDNLVLKGFMPLNDNPDLFGIWMNLM